jgi:hypothetical protein
MKKHDALFSGIIILSAGLFGSVLADSILDALEAKNVAEMPAAAITDAAAASADDPASAAALQKKFEALGLKPHEGKYWKEIK